MFYGQHINNLSAQLMKEQRDTESEKANRLAAASTISLDMSCSR